MCGLCKGLYSYCDICKHFVDVGTVNLRCAGVDDDGYECGNRMCTVCEKLEIKYCRYCVETDKAIERLIEKTKQELLRLQKEQQKHLIIYKDINSEKCAE